MTKKTLQIHSENILPIIKKWLYSDKDIFVRELVSNACDAINKLRVLRERGEADVADSEFRIDIKADKDAGTLRFIDTGIGMDAEEVEKYIAQLAFSGAEDFLKKYESNDEKDQIIGHFGLGFYSAYMVADKVEINTLSYKKDAKPVFWSCDNTHEYEIGEGTRQERGTEIILHVNEDEKEYLDPARLRQILDKYSSFLPFPIYLNDSHLNTKEPLWLKAPSECTEEEYIEFYRHLYPMAEEPLFWVHLNVDYPFHLKGILYFPRLKKDFDFSRNSIRLYCNRVFVSDNCKDLIPDYLMMLQGVIDSPDIPLNVSRSYLQMDRTVRQLGIHISKKIADRLTSLYKTDHDKFINCWKDIEVIIKLGAMQEDKFYERVKDFIVWQTLDGEWTTIADYLERHKEGYKDKIFYVPAGMDDSHFIDMYREKGIEVLQSNNFIDTHLMSFLEGKLAPVKFQRIDASVDDVIVDSSREKTVLDADGKTEAGKLAETFRKHLVSENVEVEAKSLTSDALPGFVVIDEQHRRIRDFMRSSEMKGMPGANEFMDKHTLVINTNNALINAIKDLDTTNGSLAKKMINQVYDMALLSQRELNPENLDAVIKSNYEIMTLLAEGQKK